MEYYIKNLKFQIHFLRKGIYELLTIGFEPIIYLII